MSWQRCLINGLSRQYTISIKQPRRMAGLFDYFTARLFLQKSAGSMLLNVVARRSKTFLHAPFDFGIRHPALTIIKCLHRQNYNARLHSQ